MGPRRSSIHSLNAATVCMKIYIRHRFFNAAFVFRFVYEWTPPRALWRRLSRKENTNSSHVDNLCCLQRSFMNECSLFKCLLSIHITIYAVNKSRRSVLFLKMPKGFSLNMHHTRWCICICCLNGAHSVDVSIITLYGALISRSWWSSKGSFQKTVSLSKWSLRRNWESLLKCQSINQSYWRV